MDYETGLELICMSSTWQDIVFAIVLNITIIIYYDNYDNNYAIIMIANYDY